MSTGSPPPLRGADGGFTADSIQRRLPLIIDSIVKGNPIYGLSTRAALQSLRDAIVSNAKITDALIGSDWEGYTLPVIAAGLDWMSAPWFFVENYFYKLVLKAVSSEGPHDPFQSQKDEALRSCEEAVRATVLPLLASNSTLTPNDALSLWLHRSLWGNKGDLSLSAGAALSSSYLSSSSAKAAHILIDDTAPAVGALASCSGQRIGLIMDNCGLEAVCDLCLVDALLTQVSPSSVTLYVKDAPVFVSDVMTKDVDATLKWLASVSEPTAAVAGRLRSAMDSGRLCVVENPFFTSPLPFPEMTPVVRGALSSQSVVIVKGDANYRRLLSDLQWPPTTPAADILKYFPTRLIALRTCKSSILAGVTQAAVDAAQALEPGIWCTSGNFGLILFNEPSPAGH